jgi:NAD(P)-dependent dehydrogenase (short-subunit alcohol dehydrogenase family)
MELGLKNRTVLVTAAGRGIGRSIALAFAKEQARVAVVSRTQPDIDSLMREIGGESAGHFGVMMDLEDEDSAKIIVDLVSKKLGAIEILVNNLGSTLDITNPYCTISDWRRLMRVNLEIGIELSNLVLPQMLSRNWGRICNILAGASVENHGPVPYCAAKAAFMAYTRSMGRVLAPTGVVMTGVLPGAVVTEGGHWEAVLRDRPQHAEEYLKFRTAAGRFGDCDEIAPMVLFMCSERASFFQGSQVLIDGGQVRSYSF